MGRTPLHRFAFFSVRLPGLRHISDDMPPDQVARKSLTKWRTPSAALEHLLRVESPGTNILLASCLLCGSAELNNPIADLPTLRKLLENLPTEMRADAFQLATNGDTARAGYLLLQLLPSVPPGLAPVAKKIAEQWITAGRSDDLALTFYQSLIAYGAPQVEVQRLLAQALVARSQFTQAEPLLVELVQHNPSPEVWWQLALVLQALHRSPEQHLWTLTCFIRSAPFDPRAAQALEALGDLYREMLSSRPTNANFSYAHALRGLLEFFPEHIRAEALYLMAAKHGYPLLAQILTSLPPPTLAGFSTVIQALMTSWAAEERSDDIALQFYRALPAYGISQIDAHLLLARALIKREQHGQAEPILTKLAGLSASPDVLWFLAYVYQELHRSPQLQLDAWLQFAKSSASDRRVSQALQTIGTLYRQLLNTSKNRSEALLYMQSVRTLFESFPESDRVGVLTLLFNHDEILLALVLSLLASPSIVGLDPVARDIKASSLSERTKQGSR